MKANEATIQTLQTLRDAAQKRLDAASEAVQSHPTCPDADRELWDAFDALELANDELREAKRGYRKTYPYVPGYLFQ